MSEQSEAARVDSEIDPVLRVETALVPGETSSLKARLAFRLDDYVLFAIQGDRQLHDACKRAHPYLTHGCQPVAWPKGWDVPSWCAAIPATPESIPVNVTLRCPLESGPVRSAPHRHLEFTWL